jgi:hypothetical protein
MEECQIEDSRKIRDNYATFRAPSFEAWRDNT